MQDYSVCFRASRRRAACGRFAGRCLRAVLSGVPAALLLWLPLGAEVLRVEISSRQPVLHGQPFGAYGSYELIEGRVYFGIDPANPMNAAIVDVQLAPRNQQGLVEAWANFVVLQPVERRRARGVALVEVSNRGGKFSLRYFNRASGRSLDVNDPASFGTNLLMRQGLTVIWVGWQFDVPERDGALRLHVPAAKNPDGSPIYGLVRSDWTLDEPARALQISHRNHVAYPVADPLDPANMLTVREGREAPRRVVPRSAWQFAREDSGRVVADSTYIYMAGGFQAGKIYELVYRAKDPAVAGLGLAAVRDIISYVKYNPDCPFPAKYGIAAGVSQTGRFLRHFLYQGFNTDEAGRQAYDGMMIITAGAGRGSFNHRFAQPSRDAHRYSAFFYPTDIFPFTSRAETDTVLGRTDGLLSHLHNAAHAPKTFYINTGYEYWGRAASLIHMSLDGAAEVAPLPQERIYHLAGGQHFVGRLPQNPQAGGPAYRGNPLDYSANYRALLVRLVAWVKSGQSPPPSAFPHLDRGQLVNLRDVRFPAIPDVPFPAVAHVAYRLDYGPRWAQGIIDYQPPKILGTYPIRVPQVDSLGNENDGVRNVELRVPLATYTPWNLRTGFPGGQNELTDFLGTFIPLPWDEAEKQKRHDPRPAISSLYSTEAVYQKAVEAAAAELVRQGFLLAEEVPYVCERAGRLHSWMRDLALHRP